MQDYKNLKVIVYFQLWHVKDINYIGTPLFSKCLCENDLIYILFSHLIRTSDGMTLIFFTITIIYHILGCVWYHPRKVLKHWALQTISIGIINLTRIQPFTSLDRNVNPKFPTLPKTERKGSILILKVPGQVWIALAGRKRNCHPSFMVPNFACLSLRRIPSRVSTLNLNLTVFST